MQGALGSRVRALTAQLSKGGSKGGGKGRRHSNGSEDGYDEMEH